MSGKIGIRKIVVGTKSALCLCLAMLLVMAAGCTNSTGTSGPSKEKQGANISYSVGNSGAAIDQLPPQDTAEYSKGDMVVVLGRGSMPADASADGRAAGKYFIGWSKAAPKQTDSFATLAQSVDYIPGEQLVFDAAIVLNAVYVAVASPITTGEKVFNISIAENRPTASLSTEVHGTFTNIYPDKQMVAVGELIRPRIPANYSIDGYVLKGWSITSTTVVTNPLIATNNATATAFIANAIWAPLVITTITYNANGGAGTVPSTPTRFAWPTAITLPDGAGMAAPVGKSFKGWAYSLADATAGTVVTDADTAVTGTQWKPTTQPTAAVANPAGELSLTFYAAWITSPVIAITYNINGGTGTAPEAPATLTWPDAITLPAATGMTAPSTDKEFKGWALSQSDASSGIAVTDLDSGTDGVQWKPATIPTNANPAQTFFAVWGLKTPSVITVSYNVNGSTGNAPASVTFTWPSTTTLSDGANITAPTDKVFKGWALDAILAAAGTIVADLDANTAGTQWKPLSEPTTPTFAQTLYAVWVFPVVGITYDINGGTGTAPAAPATLTWPNAVTLPDSTGMTAPANKVFKGWALTASDANAGTNIIAAGTQWKPASKPSLAAFAQTLYASWLPPVVAITYDKNGAAGNPATASATLTWPNTVALPDSRGMTPPANKAFKGWALAIADANAGTNVVTAGTQWKPAVQPSTVTTAVTLYASWVEPVINVTYDKGAGEGTAPTTPASFIWPAYLTLPLQGSMTAPTGLSFKGWTTSALGSVITDMDGDASNGTQWQPTTAPVTTPTTQTLYAVWSTTVINITYNINGGTGTVPLAPATLTWPTAVKLPDGTGMTPPDDKVFKGWADSQANATAGTTVLDSGAAEGTQWIPATKPATETSSQIFYAVWVYPVINISYNINGGSGTTPSSASLTWPATIALQGSTGITAPKDKLFKGWAASVADATAGTNVFAAGLAWKPATKPDLPISGQVFYAVWAAPIITIIFDKNGGLYNPPAQISLTWPTPATLPDNTGMGAPASLGFRGWGFTSGNNSQEDVAADSDPNTPGLQWKPIAMPTTLTSSLTLYASWGRMILIVTFDKGAGGGTVPEQMSTSFGPNTTLPGQGSMTPPTGKVFKGWALTAAAALAGTVIADEDSSTDGIQWDINFLSGNPTTPVYQTLYAVWGT